MDNNSKIIETFTKINQYFEDNKIDNKLLILDFSHFTKIDDKHCNIKTEFYGFIEQVNEYNDALLKAANKSDIWKKFSQDNVKIFDNYGIKSKCKNGRSYNLPSIEQISPPQFFQNKLSDNDFTTDIITDTLKDKVGRSMLFVSRAFNNDEAQSIIYATFENPMILIFKNGLVYNGKDFNYKTEASKLSDENNQILGHFFSLLEELLMNEMIHSLYELGLKKEREKTFDKLYHSQNEYITSILNIGKVLKKKDSELGDYISYLGNSLSSFKDIMRYKNEDIEVSREFVSLNKIIRDLEKMFNRIFRDIELNKKIYTNIKEETLEAIIKYVKENSLFHFETSLSDNLLISAPQGMAQLVIKETLSNAIKHTNVNKPVVKISLVKDHDSIILRVINSVFTRASERFYMMNPDKSSRNGMKIIYELCKYLNWEISFPIDHEKKNTIIEFKIKNDA